MRKPTKNLHCCLRRFWLLLVTSLLAEGIYLFPCHFPQGLLPNLSLSPPLQALKLPTKPSLIWLQSGSFRQLLAHPQEQKLISMFFGVYRYGVVGGYENFPLPEILSSHPTYSARGQPIFMSKCSTHHPKRDGTLEFEIGCCLTIN